MSFDNLEKEFADRDGMDQARERVRMSTKLTAMAWYNLNEQVNSGTQKVTDAEREFISGMCLESRKMYNNFDAFFDDVIKDPSTLILAQAAMGDHIHKWTDRGGPSGNRRKRK